MPLYDQRKEECFPNDHIGGNLSNSKEFLSMKYMGVVNGNLGILSHKVSVDSIKAHHEKKLKHLQLSKERNSLLKDRNKISSQYSISSKNVSSQVPQNEQNKTL